MIIDHTHPAYIKARNAIGKDRWNGAYYYSKEIVENIIPRVKTDRNWITINLRRDRIGCDHAIFFIHNHPHCPEWYEWLSVYQDLILVCSCREDMEKLTHLGTPIYLPLSIDVEYVKSFRTKKTKEIAFAGRPEKSWGYDLPEGIEYVYYLPREEFLTELAKYKKVYAVDRASIEAKVLGCEVLPYGYNTVDPGRILDTKDAANMLQDMLDEIDGVS